MSNHLKLLPNVAENWANCRRLCLGIPEAGGVGNGTIQEGEEVPLSHFLGPSGEANDEAATGKRRRSWSLSYLGLIPGLL
jgi:hypothetical protein